MKLFANLKGAELELFKTPVIQEQIVEDIGALRIQIGNIKLLQILRIGNESVYLPDFGNIDSAEIDLAELAHIPFALAAFPASVNKIGKRLDLSEVKARYVNFLELVGGIDEIVDPLYIRGVKGVQIELLNIGNL